MVDLAPRERPSLSIASFRAFLAGRPDEERWELIDGVAMMMTPATKPHQRIASNLERLLNDALEHYAPSLMAYQRLGVNIAPSVMHYDPEPDVLVIDANYGPSEDRYADRFYLAAEIVSSSDSATLDGKREIYKLHDHCKFIVIVRQDRYEALVDERTGSGWRERVLTDPNDLLELPEFGLHCVLRDLYRGTPLQAR